MTVVLQMEPLWGTADSVTALFGIPRRRLLELARAGHIRARKLSPESRSSTIVFRTADVKEWLENEAPTPRAEAFKPRRDDDAIPYQGLDQSDSGGGTALMVRPVGHESAGNGD